MICRSEMAQDRWGTDPPQDEDEEDASGGVGVLDEAWAQAGEADSVGSRVTLQQPMRERPSTMSRAFWRPDLPVLSAG